MISSKKFLVALFLMVVVLNINIIFFKESNHHDYGTAKIISEIKDHDSSFASQRMPPHIYTKAHLRPYHDDRLNGFLAVSRSPGHELADDVETLSLAQVMASKDSSVIVHEIKHYAFEPLYEEMTLQNIQGHGKFAGEMALFLTQLSQAIQNHKPRVPGINNDGHYAQAKEENQFPHREGHIPLYGGHFREQYTDEPIRSKEYLSYFLRLSDVEINELQAAHRSFLAEMPQDFPEYVYKSGKLSQFMSGDGIVYLGGGKYSQLALMSISILRELGSVLPVEVILPRRSDFDMDFCASALPSLNARCKVLEDYLPKSITETLNGYQLKNMALLVCSFQNVLYLDADNIPMKNPDHMFVNEPFLSSRMVVWPDLWRRSTSPYFYTIADIDTDENFKMRNSYTRNDHRGKSPSALETSFHDTRGTIAEASSETGQLLIDKKKHVRSLFLAMYYNYYGPEYFYALLSQGAAGEGDKETFVAAAHKLGLPYYQVNEFNREFGPLNKLGKREFHGMGQYDPIVDYLESKTKGRVEDFDGTFAKDEKDSQISNYDRHFYRSHSLMFLHANWPKFLLEELFLHNSYGRGMKIPDGRRRLYTEDFMTESNGMDIEMTIIHHIKVWFCDARLNMKYVPASDSKEREDVCKEVEAQLEFLRNN